MTAWNEPLTKLKNAGVSAQKRGDRPQCSPWVRKETQNAGDRVTQHVLKPWVETGSDHLVTGRPGSYCKAEETNPRRQFRRKAWNFHLPAISCFCERAD